MSGLRLSDLNKETTTTTTTTEHVPKAPSSTTTGLGDSVLDSESVMQPNTGANQYV